MHKLAVAELVKAARRRQGDCSGEPRFSVEQLEDALITLADMFEQVAPGRLGGLPSFESLREKIATDRDVDTEAGLLPPLRKDPP